MIRGLKTRRSLGSFREISRSPHYFFLDTAHNTLSLPVVSNSFDERALTLDQQSVFMIACHESLRSADRSPDMLPVASGVSIYNHTAKLEGNESFKLVLDSLEGERRVYISIITSLVGRVDSTSAAGLTTASSS